MGDPTIRPIVVAGFGRCVSTMAMHMLRAGGIPWVPGTHEVSGEQTLPVQFMAGYASKHLFTNVDHVRSVHWWPRVTVLWCSRAPREQARSGLKFAEGFGIPFPRISVSSLARQIEQWEREAAAFLVDSGAQLAHLDFDNALRDPVLASRMLADRLGLYVGAELDMRAMASVIHRRSPRCLPDLAYEMSRLTSPKDTP